MNRETYLLQRKCFLELAKLAEKAKKSNDLRMYMKKIVDLDTRFRPDKFLSDQEKRLLELGYKKQIALLRRQWHLCLDSRHQRMNAPAPAPASTSAEDDPRRDVVANDAQVRRLEEELSTMCNEMLTVINAQFLGLADRPETLISYFKLKGDYTLLLAEVKDDIQRCPNIAQALHAYGYATSIATWHLEPDDSVRLGLGMFFFKSASILQLRHAKSAELTAEFKAELKEANETLASLKSVCETAEEEEDTERVIYFSRLNLPALHAVLVTKSFTKWSQVLFDSNS